jgi:hypothetical protein
VRLIKMLGLASVAAIAAMALIGVGTASATLCKANESPCAAGNTYTPPTTVTTLSKGVVLKAALGEALCESEATLKHEKTEGSKLKGTITGLTWSNCTGCTTVTTTTLGTFDDEATGGGNGTILPLGTVVLLKGCPLGVECTASAISGTTILSLTGGAVGKANGVANTKVSLSGFGCGSTGEWKTEATTPYFLTAINGVASGNLFIE